MVTVSSALWDTYKEFADFFIDDNNIGKSCTLVYPPLREACSNCVINSVSGGSLNIYRHGGPAPFNFGACPMCGGNGYRETETTTTIRLRVYYNRRDWNRIVGNIQIPDATAMVIGYLTDLTKLRQATEIRLVNEQSQNEWVMALAGEPFLHGFGKNRYFIAYLKRV